MDTNKTYEVWIEVEEYPKQLGYSRAMNETNATIAGERTHTFKPDVSKLEFDETTIHPELLDLSRHEHGLFASGDYRASRVRGIIRSLNDSLRTRDENTRDMRKRLMVAAKALEKIQAMARSRSRVNMPDGTSLDLFASLALNTINLATTEIERKQT